MVRIQLETGYLDVKEGAAFPLNFGIGDVRDLSKRSSTFSKTITLIGSKNNHDLLNHYYDVNIQAGTFDINALTPCTIIQNGIPVVEDAYLQLLSVEKIQYVSSVEEEIEYEVLVKDAQADFFTKIDNGLLEEIDFTDFNHTFNSLNVVNSFSNTWTDGYVYPICSTDNNWYPLKEMRPAIYAKQYWDRIHSNAGFSYTWSTLSDAYFDKLIIPFNGDALQFNYEDYDVEARKSYTATFTQTAGTSTSDVSLISGWTEGLDTQNLFTPASGGYAVPIYVTSGESINFRVTLDYDFNLINGTGATAYLVEYPSATIVTKKYTYAPYIALYKNGVETFRQYTGGAVKNEGSLANGTTTLVSIQNIVNIPATNLLPTDILTLRAGVNVTFNGTAVAPRWRNNATAGAGADVQIDYAIDFNSIEINVGINSTTLASGATATMNSFIPKQIKQKDFIKSICQMYNLMVEPDQDNPNKLIYTHRDDYYDSGTEKDWSKKLAKDRGHQVQFLPELAAKKLVLSYKQDTDEPNKIYYDTTQEVYSQVEYTFDNEYVRGTEKKELIFTPSPMEKNIIFGAVTPMVYGFAPKTGLRVLIHNGTASCYGYAIYDYGTTGQGGLTTYPVCHHWNDPYNPTFSIEFATNDFYFYDNYQITNNTLYNMYWRRTINQINTGKMLTGYFNLKEVDIQTMKLNDKIWLFNSWWNINKVIDYDCNSNSLTKVELLSVDTEIDFAKFISKTPKPTTPTPANNAGVNIVDRRFKNENVNYSQGSVIVRGYGNVIGEGLKGFVEGDDQVINESGFYASNMPTVENFANTDLTFDGTRNHDTNGYNLNVTTDAGGYAEGWLSVRPTEVYLGFDTEYIQAVNGEIILFANTSPVARVTDDLIFVTEQGRKKDLGNISSTQTLILSEHIINCTANTFTLYLPTAVGNQGQEYVVKNSGTGVITLEGDGTETIDGNLNLTLNQYDSYTVVSDGANWIIV